MTTSLESRLRARSLWLDGVPSVTPRAALAGDVDVDVAIVGGGLTGLWTAWYLRAADPALRVAVIEREIAGFGASGRNGGWVSAGLAADHRIFARKHGVDATARAERATYAAVDEIARVVEEQGIDCGFAKGGQIQVACTAAQLERLRAAIAKKRTYGATEDDLRLLEADELRERVRVEGARAASFSPHCARVDPARLTRGLADAVERAGATIYEQTAALAIEPGRVACTGGVVRARHVLRTTEAFTVQLPHEKRRFLPLYSLMIATEPLPAAVWDEIGWSRGECVSDTRHLFFYAQRTQDDRIAIGGRGAPYRLGSPIDERYERREEVRDRLVRTVRRHWPQAASARITHHWGGALAVPRDWCLSAHHDRATGLGWGGGYSGHGVVATNLVGRTLADLALGRDTDLARMPWVDHHARLWEPEPLRFVASRAIVRIMGQSDEVEETLPRTARRMKLIDPFISGR